MNEFDKRNNLQLFEEGETKHEYKHIPLKIYDKREEFFAAYELFHKTLRVNFHDFMDVTLSSSFLRPILDMGKFDDWLHDKYGQYEDEGLSMWDVLVKNYGEITALTVKELL
jgi:hypothetical protein